MDLFFGGVIVGSGGWGLFRWDEFERGVVETIG